MKDIQVDTWDFITFLVSSYYVYHSSCLLPNHEFLFVLFGLSSWVGFVHRTGTVETPVSSGLYKEGLFLCDSIYHPSKSLIVRCCSWVRSFMMDNEIPFLLRWCCSQSGLFGERSVRCLRESVVLYDSVGSDHFSQIKKVRCSRFWCPSVSS